MEGCIISKCKEKNRVDDKMIQLDDLTAKRFNNRTI